MSRSYRKPCYKDCKSGKKAKTEANRKLRRTGIIFEMSSYCNYKRYYNSWNIYDFKVLWTDSDVTNSFRHDFYIKLRRK